jgi:hypothetical protein
VVTVQEQVALGMVVCVVRVGGQVRAGEVREVGARAEGWVVGWGVQRRLHT